MKMFRGVLVMLALALAPASLAAQAAPASPAAQAAPAAVPAEAAPLETAALAPAGAAAPAPDAAQPAAPAPAGDGSLPGYSPMAPTQGVGMPRDGELDFQDQYSPNGQYAYWINNTILLPIIIAISLFVLGLLGWVIVRYRRAANQVPSKTSHNTVIEVIWTAVPVLILLVIAVPSLDLLAKQYKPAPANAVTVKVTGYQWYWGYTYPDHGGFEVISNMLPERGMEEDGKRFRTAADGPRLMAVDNRMVVPAGVPLRIQTTGADVIHSFAVPSLWFKLDAVPGRLNEKELTITKPGVYYGQCSELCGARHAFMPIAIEALPPARFAAWIRAKGGTMPNAAPGGASATPAPSINPAAPPAEGAAPGSSLEPGKAGQTQTDMSVNAEAAPVASPAGATPPAQ